MSPRKADSDNDWLEIEDNPIGPQTDLVHSSATATAGQDLDRDMVGSGTKSLLLRDQRGWGSAYNPPIRQANGRREFRRICNDIDAEIRRLDDMFVDGTVADEAAGVMAEIEILLERLYDCRFGEGESLKSAVVAIQSQVNNAEWTTEHVSFLKSAIQFLRVRSVVNDQTVEEIDDLIEEHGLDVFRGTVSEPEVVRQYRLERVEE